MFFIYFLYISHIFLICVSYFSYIYHTDVEATERIAALLGLPIPHHLTWRAEQNAGCCMYTKSNSFIHFAKRFNVSSELFILCIIFKIIFNNFF